MNGHRSSATLASLVIATLAMLGVPAARAQPKPAWRAKKDLDYASKKAGFNARLRPVVGQPARKLINFYNTWTDEWLAIDPEAYAKELRLAKPRRQPLPRLTARTYDEFLRCHFTNEATVTEPRLPVFALSAALHFHAPVVDVVSAFRHPKYNLMLRKKGHQVARESQHTFGHAIDFRLRGVNVQALHAWAVAQKHGGVGFYLESGFIHMDVGPIRYWNGE
ncbi:MAG: YcbK family protein [Kofleriaceae bacterium]|nr:YcbK family protein [Kofleriaceae bacterium]